MRKALASLERRPGAARRLSLGVRCVALVALGAGLGVPSAARAESVVGLGPGFYVQDSVRDFESESDGAPFQARDDEEAVSDGLFNLNAWWLTRVSERLRAGAGLTWYNSYTLKPADAEDPDEGDYCEQANDCYRIGHLFQLSGQLEYVIPDVASKLDVALGARLGLEAAFAKGELQEELDAWDSQGYDVIAGAPRVGGFAGPFAAAIWPLSERLDLRGELGVQFSRLGLYDVEAETIGPLRREASGVSTTRYNLLLGVEIHL